jgi:hypothetical protein
LLYHHLAHDVHNIVDLLIRCLNSFLLLLLLLKHS